MEGPNHAAQCGVFVAEALSFAESHAIPLDAVAVSEGPGSYTGLRIGYSMAKGVCYGRNVPLISLPTLEVLCVPILLGKEMSEYVEDSVSPLLVPMIDARRMEVYSAVYDRALKPVRGIQADIVDADTYREYLDRGPVYFFGDGAEKTKTVIQHPNAHFIDNIHPLAKYMQPLAERKFLREEFVDVAYSEPFYLKEFEAKPSKPLL
jgi:tRNA threonylcarbamoyladenosine biosynthesis protein TsaB